MDWLLFLFEKVVYVEYDTAPYIVHFHLRLIQGAVKYKILLELGNDGTNNTPANKF
jgi:hypothetical protein